MSRFARRETLFLGLLLFLSLAFNAVTLWPEVSVGIPSNNDDAFHYLFIQRASQALTDGEDVVDFWVPEIELGFADFVHYQHLPHLAVVLLDRLLVERVDLLTLFDAVRYFLLVTLPLTVFWSLRRMGFTPPAAAVAGAAAPLISTNHLFGFDYESYVWRGFGVYAQLWAMHLAFVTLACLHTVVERQRGHLAAIVAFSALTFSHLLYAYVMAASLVVLFLVGLDRAKAFARVRGFAVVGTGMAIVTAYMWLPFVQLGAYLNISPYLQQSKYDSFGAPTILGWLVSGQLFDQDRLPVLTGLLALGIGVSAVARTRLAVTSLALFVLWLVLYFGRPTLGPLADLLPFHQTLLFHRFSGAVHLAAIPLIGVGGGWLYDLISSAVPSSWRYALAAAAVLVVLAPAFVERNAFYAQNAQWMSQTRDAVAADADQRAIIAKLRELPSGRVFAGLPVLPRDLVNVLRTDWGPKLDFGLPFRGIHFTDLLVFDDVLAVVPPYNSSSLNADMIWYFDYRNPAHYDLFAVRYVVAPAAEPMPSFLRPLLRTARYTLYESPSGAYAGFVEISGRRAIATQQDLVLTDRAWLLGDEPAAKRFVRYDYPAKTTATNETVPGCTGGSVNYERDLPSRSDLVVTCPDATTLVIKVSYHPNWVVTVDGTPVADFLVTPAYIGVRLPPGQHFVTAEYRSTPVKAPLLAAGGITLGAAVIFRRQIAWLGGGA